jgi:excisionase family DNA binding protein
MTQRTLLLSRREAAEQLGVSTDTIARLIARGQLRAVRIGRAVRVPREDVALVAARGAEQPREVRQ